jgi:hypothetical protein
MVMAWSLNAVNIAYLDAVVEAEYQAAVLNPERRHPVEVLPNVTVQTDLYVAPEGQGFRVVCNVADPTTFAVVSRVKNYGPDAQSETPWPDDVADELRRRGERLQQMLGGGGA